MKTGMEIADNWFKFVRYIIILSILLLLSEIDNDYSNQFLSLFIISFLAFMVFTFCFIGELATLILKYLVKDLNIAEDKIEIYKKYVVPVSALVMLIVIAIFYMLISGAAEIIESKVLVNV
jgi:hypothetical protein